MPSPTALESASAQLRFSETLRRWLAQSGDTSIATVKKYVGLLPNHLVQRFIAKDGNGFEMVPVQWSAAL